MEFLNTHEKIKKLRKELHMRQHELADDHITTAFISMIELERRGLSKSTAKRIAEKFNEKAKTLGISLNIDADYLLCSPEEEAEKYCLDKLSTMKTVEETKEILQICQKLRLEKAESRIHSFMANILFEEENYDTAFLEYSFAIDLCKSNENRDMQPYLYNRCGRCKSNLLNYNEALFLFNRANYYAAIFNDQTTERHSLHNIAFCHKKLNNLEECINIASTYLSTWDAKSDFPTYFSINILKANCHQDQGDLDAALDLHTSMLNTFSDFTDSQLGLIYTNIGSIYLDKGLYSESMNYFNKAQKIRSTSDKFNLSHTLIEKSKVFMKRQLPEEALLLIELGLEMADLSNNIESLIKGYTLLETIYTEENNIEKLKEVYIKLLDILNGTENPQDAIKIYTSLARLYLDENDSEKLKECILLSQKLTGRKINFEL